MDYSAKPKKERSDSYILRVSKVANGNLKNLVEQAEADETVEVLPDLPPSPNHNDRKKSTPDLSRPRNSFLVRVQKKKRRRQTGARRRGKGKYHKDGKRADFMRKLHQDAKAGKVDCFEVNNESSKGTLIRRLSHKDIHEMTSVAPKLPPEFQSSPGIQESRSSYYNVLNNKLKAAKNEKAVNRELEHKDQGEPLIDDGVVFNNAEIARVQGEYIEALESEVKRSKVRADLLSRSLKMEMARLEKLIAEKDKDLMHKDLLLQSLQVQNMNMEKSIGQKDDIVAIQGELVAGLEVENDKLNQQLEEHSIPFLTREKSTSDLQCLYRRISSERL